MWSDLSSVKLPGGQSCLPRPMRGAQDGTPRGHFKELTSDRFVSLHSAAPVSTEPVRKPPAGRRSKPEWTANRHNTPPFASASKS